MYRMGLYARKSDNSADCRSCWAFQVLGITITSVNVNKELLGMRAVDKMLWRIANRDSNTEKTLIYAEIMMRESTI